MKKSLLVIGALLLLCTPVFADDSYKISVSATPVGTTRVTVTATSLLPISSSGYIEIRKTGETSGTFCQNVTFPVGTPATNCVATSLTAGTYTIFISAKGTDGKGYSGQSSFTIPPTSTSPSTGSGSTQQGIPSTAGSSQSGIPGRSPQQSGIPGVPSGSTSPGQSTGTILDVHLNNPLKVNNIQDAVKFFVNTLIKIAIPFIVVFFIWAGLKFILAQGKPDKITEAKKMFWYTIIGTLLILGAWTITNAIIGTVNSIVN